MVKRHLSKVIRKYNSEDKNSYDYVLTQNERNYPIPQTLLKNLLIH